jgi:hypothetical protein
MEFNEEIAFISLGLSELYLNIFISEQSRILSIASYIFSAMVLGLDICLKRIV